MTGCNGENGALWEAILSNEGGMTEDGGLFCVGGFTSGGTDVGGSWETGGGAVGFIMGGGWLNCCGDWEMSGLGTNMGLGPPLGRWCAKGLTRGGCWLVVGGGVGVEDGTNKAGCSSDGAADDFGGCGGGWEPIEENGSSAVDRKLLK